MSLMVDPPPPLPIEFRGGVIVLLSLKSLYSTTFISLLYASGAFAATFGVCAVARRHSTEVHVRVAHVINPTTSVMTSTRAVLSILPAVRGNPQYVYHQPQHSVDVTKS